MLSASRLTNGRCRHSQMAEELIVEAVIWDFVVAGFPVVDVKVDLIDGKYHDVDSSALAFEIAARAAFREALHKARSVLLEPIMKVEVMSPEDCIASVISDLNLADDPGSRHARQRHRRQRDGAAHEHVGLRE